MSTQSLIFRNRRALVGWIFMAQWMAMVCLMSRVLLRNLAVPGRDGGGEMVALVVFWTLGLAGCAYCFSQPIVSVVIGNGQVRVRERFIIFKRQETFPIAQLSSPRLVEERDADDDLHFYGELTTLAGRAVRFVVRKDRQEVEAACARVMEAIS